MNTMNHIVTMVSYFTMMFLEVLPRLFSLSFSTWRALIVLFVSSEESSAVTPSPTIVSENPVILCELSFTEVLFWSSPLLEMGASSRCTFPLFSESFSPCICWLKYSSIVPWVLSSRSVSDSSLSSERSSATVSSDVSGWPKWWCGGGPGNGPNGGAPGGGPLCPLFQGPFPPCHGNGETGNGCVLRASSEALNSGETD